MGKSRNPGAALERARPLDRQRAHEIQAFNQLVRRPALAPKQTEPPFVVSQGIVLVLFVVLPIVAALRFRTEGRPQA